MIHDDSISFERIGGCEKRQASTGVFGTVQLLASQPTKKWYIEHCYCHCFLLLVADDSGQHFDDFFGAGGSAGDNG
jgi:hypothetical protein